MTQRLTDDEIAKLRERTRIDAASHLHLVARDAITALLDEIEERRRNDARRLADAEQAKRYIVIDENLPPMTEEQMNAIWAKIVAGRKRKVEQLPSAIKVPMPKGKDGGERCSEEYFSLGHQMQLRCELPFGHDGLHAKEWGDGNSCKWLGKDGGA